MNINKQWVSVVILGLSCVGASPQRDTNMLRGILSSPREVGRVAGFSVMQGKTLSGNDDLQVVAETSQGRYWSLTSSSTEMVWDVDQGAAMFFDVTNRNVTRIVLNIVLSGGGKVTLIDYNGDGVPDVRRTANSEGVQIFYRGEFLDSTGTSRVRSAQLDGRKRNFRFSEGRWVVDDSERTAQEDGSGSSH